MKSVHSSLALGIFILACVPSGAWSQHPWQRPEPPLPMSEVKRIIGPLTAQAPSRDVHIVWVWGYDQHHRPGNHDYTRVRDLMTGLLKGVPRVSVDTAYEFPSRAQFAAADVLVLYLHLPMLLDEHLAQVDAFLERGGGLVAIHETMIQRPLDRGRAWSQRIGLAWAEGRSLWGPLYTDVELQTQLPIFQRLPARMPIVDEFYWDLAGESSAIDLLGTTPAGPDGDTDGPAAADELDGKAWPVFWTVTAGEGRVFASLPGHNTFQFYSPRFRIILLRGLAWAAKERPDPFLPLVYEGITSGGMVGTTHTFRDWPDKPRKPGDEP